MGWVDLDSMVWHLAGLWRTFVYAVIQLTFLGCGVGPQLILAFVSKSISGLSRLQGTGNGREGVTTILFWFSKLAYVRHNAYKN